eukprot:CAMPEP_0172845946 /NCGR_PEP_ID=MMETSP1075-20121228/35384_1 /TAXON_ID=2916 /ORGANISM="Ceratium fusus, Strain PA161109" /LENGTH=41 /DNA_ID= /DNA_START= /DNA_END= /DNA_ORIENTATION=
MEHRQAISALAPALMKGLNRHHTMKICVTPPPRLPHPAAVA